MTAAPGLFDRGETWSTYHKSTNRPVLPAYNRQPLPHRIYAAQQDNSTVRILHRMNRVQSLNGTGTTRWGGAPETVVNHKDDEKLSRGLRRWLDLATLNR